MELKSFRGEKGLGKREDKGEERGSTEEEVEGEWREALGFEELEVIWDFLDGNRVV